MLKFIVSQLTLNLAQGSIKFNFPFEAAQALKVEIDNLMQKLKIVASKINNGEQKKAEESLDYQYIGEVFIENFLIGMGVIFVIIFVYSIWKAPFGVMRQARENDEK